MRLIRSAEQAALDRAWQAQTGLPLILLMEAAAGAVAGLCRRLAAEQAVESLPVLVLCGRGQNGGDAYACARMLASAGWPVVCRELFPDAGLPDEAAANRTALVNLGFKLSAPQEADFTGLHGGLIIDGIFGTGFKVDRGVPELFRSVSQWTAAARVSGNRIVAIDIPSGLDSNSGQMVDCAIRADWTATFVLPKIGLCTAPGCFLSDRLLVDPIGMGDDFVASVLQQQALDPVSRIDAAAVRPWCPARPPDGHKGLFGRLLVAGGSDTMPGALALAAEAAARSGIGLLQLALPRIIRSALLAACPEALQLPIDQDEHGFAEVLSALDAADAVVLGPGLGHPGWLPQLLERAILQACHLLIDADAINEISRHPEHYGSLLHKRRLDRQLDAPIMTPHPGEFRRLAPDLDLQDRRQAACTLAKRLDCLIILKGAATIIAEPDGTSWINSTGQDGLARGGSGDVLSGLIGGLLAQGLTTRQAACAGVYFHGLAADLAAKKKGRRAMLPRDVLDCLGSAWRQAGWEVEDV